MASMNASGLSNLATENPTHLLQGHAFVIPATAASAQTATLGAGLLADTVTVTNGSSTGFVRVTLIATGTLGNLAFLVHPGQAKSLTFQNSDLITAVTVEPVNVVATGVANLPATAVLNATPGSLSVVTVEFLEM